MPGRSEDQENLLKETPPAVDAKVSETAGIDLSVLQDSLRMTPWERMRANDDALNFGEALRSAMQKRNAKSQ